MTKKEVEGIAYKAMNFPNPGDRQTTTPEDTGTKDEVDSSDVHEGESQQNTMNYCPGCGMKLR